MYVFPLAINRSQQNSFALARGPVLELALDQHDLGFFKGTCESKTAFPKGPKCLNHLGSGVLEWFTFSAGVDGPLGFESLTFIVSPLSL